MKAKFHEEPIRGPFLPVIFVYGTLKEGESNHGLLAPFVRSIEPGWIQGRLYDAGDFPALTDGEQKVHGELIRLDPARMEQVIKVIDRLEGYVPGREDLSLYCRRIVTTTTQDGRGVQAYAYFYNRDHGSLPTLEMLRPIESGRWVAPREPAPDTGMEAFEEFRESVRRFNTDRE